MEPENLHNVAKGTDKKLSVDYFVSPGTPTTPLATEADLANPVLSASGTKTLRDGLIKG